MYVRELKVDSNGKTRLQWRKKNESIYSGYIYIYLLKTRPLKSSHLSLRPLIVPAAFLQQLSAQSTSFYIFNRLIKKQ